MAIGRSCYLLHRRKICIHCDIHCYGVTSTSVIVRINYCRESVFRKSLSGEFVTTMYCQNAFRMACPLVYRGKANSGRSASWWKQKVPKSSCTMRLCTVVITLLGYTCITCNVVATYCTYLSWPWAMNNKYRQVHVAVPATLIASYIPEGIFSPLFFLTHAWFSSFLHSSFEFESLLDFVSRLDHLM